MAPDLKPTSTSSAIICSTRSPVTVTNTIVLFSASALGEKARPAMACFSFSTSALVKVRLYRTSGSPAASRLLAMLKPMWPSPAQPTFSAKTSSLGRWARLFFLRLSSRSLRRRRVEDVFLPRFSAFLAASSRTAVVSWVGFFCSCLRSVVYSFIFSFSCGCTAAESVTARPRSHGCASACLAVMRLEGSTTSRPEMKSLASLDTALQYSSANS
mmetsp:Transcript_4661/g.11576  ORF Transcript_4661/g.11576 Transcript_4661/m.11576 type:complete len:214 (+) Transcript_4661:909-1550(+)